MSDESRSNNSDPPADQPKQNWIVRSVTYGKRKFEEYRSRKQQESSTDRAARSTARATWFIVLLTGVIAIVGYYQWRALNSTDHHISHQVKIATDVMKLDQRAWIGLESLDAVPNFPEIDKTFGAKGVIRNTGKTPATSIFIYSIIEPVLTEDRPNFSYTNVTGFYGGMLPPNGKALIPLNIIPEENSKIPALFKQEQLDLLKNGRFNIYSHGRIEYVDIFGDPHWMTYCSFLLPSGGFAFCREHNETDDNKKTKK